MRRLIIYLTIAAFTFFVGFVAYKLCLAPNPIPHANEPLTVSLCELEKSPEQYDGKVVRVKAVLYSDLGGPYIYDWSCGSQNIYTYPLIDVRGFDSLNTELQEWVKNIGSINAKGEGMEADVIVVGIFDKSYSDPGDDAFAHLFRIIPKSIEQLTSLHRRK